MVHVTVKGTSMTTVGGVVIVRAVMDVAGKINATRRRLCQAQREKDEEKRERTYRSEGGRIRRTV
jgi:hypothetical protein